MKTGAEECLREPMLQILARIIAELKDQLQVLNELVKKEAGIVLNMEITHVCRVADDDWRIKVKGNSFTGRENEEEFKLVWWSHTCPANFHLLQWGKGAFSFEYNFLYSGVVEPNARYIAREIAIYTHHQQIPKVLSRV